MLRHLIGFAWFGLQTCRQFRPAESHTRRTRRWSAETRSPTPSPARDSGIRDRWLIGQVSVLPELPVRGLEIL